MFSPYYAWDGRSQPSDHVSINVALYGLKPGAPNRWAMTERGEAALSRTADSFTVGPSQLSWEGSTLVVDVDEVTVPLPRRLRGQIRFTPSIWQPSSLVLDSKVRHRWWPYAPAGHMEVRFEKPKLAWTGHGYADSNWGSAALEADFKGWSWARAKTADGTALLYDPLERSGRHKPVALHVGRDGIAIPFDPPPDVALDKGFWGVARSVRSEAPSRTKLIKTLEDAPFYTRNAVETVLNGEVCPAVHESLNLDRFKNPGVKLMLPFRMPRRTRWP